jgi:hypothetical protein
MSGVVRMRHWWIALVGAVLACAGAALGLKQD